MPSDPDKAFATMQKPKDNSEESTKVEKREEATRGPFDVTETCMEIPGLGTAVLYMPTLRN